MAFPSKPCTESTCDFYINFSFYLNCSSVAATIKPHTLEEIGRMTQVTRERVRQIEEEALKKARSLSRMKYLKDFIPAGAQKVLILKYDDERITIDQFRHLVGDSFKDSN